MVSWRSEDMLLVRITMQREALHDSIQALGERGLVEFIDATPHMSAFQRQYANEVRRCEELERKLRYFEDQIKQSKGEINKNSLRSITNDDSEQHAAVSLDHLEQEFDQYEKQLRQLNSSLEQLTTKKLKEAELLAVIDQGGEFLNIRRDEETTESTSAGSDTNMIEENRGRQMLGSFAGVIPRDKVATFHLLINRATRYKGIPKFVEIKEPMYDARAGKDIEKNVFVVFFPEGESRNKVRKIIESVYASIHDFPEGDVQQARESSETTVREYERTIQQTKQTKADILGELSGDIDTWKRKIAKEKAIYHTMNMFNYIRDSAVGDAWIPKLALENINNILHEAQQVSQAQVHTVLETIPIEGKTPPTYFQTNEFTEVFQSMVNAYGIPRYKEFNPAPISMVSFPFLFAVMFGDYGHGIIFSLFALFLIICSKPIGKIARTNELLGMVFSGRWVLLLMGLFSIFTGLLYNDIFSLALDLFGTAYDFEETPSGVIEGTKVRGTYAFGVDPAWYGTANRLAYYNSLKMKMSIIFGVTQMMIGIFFSCLNHIKFKRYEDIFFEFIPEVLILGLSFGYLSFMIIYKWCVNYDCATNPKCTPAPSLLSTMTDFFLHPHGLQQPELFPGQLIVQIVFLSLFVLSVPVLFLPKPIFEYCVHARKTKQHGKGEVFDQLDDPSEKSESYQQSQSQAASSEQEKKVARSSQIVLTTVEEGEHKQEAPAQKHAEEHEEFDFSDILIKQMIHTVEFTLGSVSNTASYLRLWALSLAHSQLSEVFWDMTVKMLITVDIHAVQVGLVQTGIGIFFIFLIWFSLTIGVLLVMESLSAFLHAIRLHWVEFQSKFFVGDGYLFSPLNFADIDNQIDIENDLAAQEA